jgi:signal peptidase
MFVQSIEASNDFVPGKRADKHKKKESATKKVLSAMFYVSIILIMIAALILSSGKDGKYGLLGYSGFTVLSRSMQSEIPKDSLIITKKVAPESVELGDTLTFTRIDNETVTHKVIDIIENYEGTGARGFKTKGVDNAGPDREIVYAANVIGIVKLSIPAVGRILAYISENMGLLFVFIGAIAVIAILLKKLSNGRRVVSISEERGL